MGKIFCVVTTGLQLNPVPIAGNLEVKDEETDVVVLVTEEEDETTVGVV